MSSICKCPECRNHVFEFEYVCPYCRRVFWRGIFQMGFAFVVAFSIFGGVSILGNYHDKSEIVSEIATGRGIRFAIFMAICGIVILLTIAREALFDLPDERIAAHTKRIMNALIEEAIVTESQRMKLSKRTLNTSARLLDEAVELKDADPEDQVSALYHRAVIKREQDDKEGALKDLLIANQISIADIEWKWKIYSLIGQVKLELLDFQGYVDSLTAALKTGYCNQYEVDKTRLFLARGKFGIGDFEGARHELLQLIENESVDLSNKEKATIELLILKDRMRNS